MSIFSWIAIALALIPIFFASRHKCEHRKGHSFFAVLAVLVVLSGVLLFFIGIRPPAPPLNVAYVEENGQVKLTEYAKALQPSAPDPSLEALWDKLTKSKINLEGETDSAPIADPNNEAVKHAVGKSFRLDEQGKLPPPWVITPPKRIGQVYRESIASDPFVTENECRRQLGSEQLPQAVARRIEQLASAQVGHTVTVDNPLLLGIGLDYIFREICRDEFTATVDSSVGEMKKTHVLLEFNSNNDQYLVDAWLRHERHQRLAAFGKVAGLSLIGLAAAYGLLRFDTWSKGYYSKQLLVGSVLAIIALAVVLLKA